MKTFRILLTAAMGIALAIGGASCSSSRHVHNHRCGRGCHHSEVIIKGGGKADKTHRLIAEAAYDWLGTPYAYAHAEKGHGTDCSGMVMKIYEEVGGCRIPRNSAKQAEYCIPLRDKEAGIGDLVFFATGKDKEKVSHVGIMVSDVDFIHASSSKGVVKSNMSTPYYQRTFKMFGRVPMGGKAVSETN